MAKDGDKLLAEEQQLVRDAQKGDGASFSVLVQRYYDRLQRYLYQMTRDRHATEDITQETFMKAWAAIGRFKAGTNFRAWLFRIGHNNCINLHRSRSTQRQPMPEETVTKDPGPLDEVLAKEGLEKLASAVANLSEDFRSALLLRVDEGMSFRTIAAILGITEETARWRVFKARHRLGQVIWPEVFSGSDEFETAPTSTSDADLESEEIEDGSQQNKGS